MNKTEPEVQKMMADFISQNFKVDYNKLVVTYWYDTSQVTEPVLYVGGS